MAQLMPLSLTVSCFSKIQTDLPLWYRLTWVVPDKGPLNVCVCVCASAYLLCCQVAIRGLARALCMGEFLDAAAADAAAAAADRQPNAGRQCGDTPTHPRFDATTAATPTHLGFDAATATTPDRRLSSSARRHSRSPYYQRYHQRYHEPPPSPTAARPPPSQRRLSVSDASVTSTRARNMFRWRSSTYLATKFRLQCQIKRLSG